MTTALEVLDTKRYGVFDMDQIKLINNHNAYDLVLIENATELFREVMHEKPDSLETLLKAIVDNTDTDCVYLPSKTFPYYISPETERDYDLIGDNKRVSRQVYNADVKEYRRKYLVPQIKRNSCIIGLFAVDLGKHGGHYAAYMWNTDTRKLIIFDSMTTNYRSSIYYPYFQQLGRDLFGNPREMAMPCIKNLVSLQQTGGFSENVPYRTRQILKPQIQAAVKAKDRDQELILRDLQNSIAIQSTESQNHFCYIWSVWFIHLLLLKYSPEDVIESLSENRIDPLFVIKRYAWSLMKKTGLDQLLNHKELYRDYFPRVWVNVDSPITDDFKPYKIDMPDCEDINECLKASFSPVKLEEVPLTKPPMAVTELVEKQLL